MKRGDWLLYAALGVLLLTSIGFFAWAWQAAVRRDADPFRAEMIDKVMREKEQAAQTIEQAIEKSDYRRIEVGIVRLRELATAADWYAADDLYRQHSEAFRATLDRLNRSVQDRNLDAVRQTYAELRVTCSACHAQNQSSSVSLD